jgi:hypothetical protein
MGINYSQISACTKKCDCENLGDLILKENRKNMLDIHPRQKARKNRRYTETKNSFQITKETSNAGQIFSNQIIAYINDNKSFLKNENNNSNNNPNTYRSTNVQSNINKKTNNISFNNNDNSINNNFNKNNITIEKKDDESSIYDDNRDSFIKMENNIIEEDYKFDRDLVLQFSKIEEKMEKSVESEKEKNQSNMNLDNANIEDLMDLMEKKNIENEGTIIEYEGEKCLYKGHLENKNKISGKGKIYFKDGRIFDGNFVDGKLDGEGKYISSNGDIFEGFFIGGKILGKGVIIKAREDISKSHIKTCKEEDSNNIDKIIYKGEIKEFKKEGFGIEYSSDYKYEGHFHNDMKNGKGVLTYLKSKDKYEGEFKDDKITGKGYYIWENGHSYKGDFIDGKMHGNGLYRWPDGSEYEGEYKENIREGKGRFKWKNGIYFEGNFVDGKPDGKGKMIYENEFINVEYKDKKFVGDLKDTMRNLLKSVSASKID